MVENLTPTAESEERAAPASPSFFERSGLSRWLQENWSGGLTKEAKERVEFHYTALANTFLRDIPLTARARVVEHLTDVTKHFLSWEEQRGAAQASHHFLFGSAIQLEDGEPQRWAAWHEGTHILQHEGYLPYNHPLTYAVTAMVDIERGRGRFVHEKEGDGGYFRKEYLDRDAYFRLVKEDRAHEAFTNGWMLNPGDDKDYWDFKRYLDRERDFEREFATYGEGIENRFGIRRPYNIMMGIGTARGERAYAIGHLSGSADNAWSVLYLHARGLPFGEAERTVVEAIETGREDRLLDFRSLEAGEVKRLAAYEEVFGARKLWEERFPEPLRPAARKLLAAKDSVVEAALAIKQSLEKVSEEEVRQRYGLFSAWLESKQSGDVVDLSDVAEFSEIMLNRSLNEEQEFSANTFVLPDPNGNLRLSLTGVRGGVTIGPGSFTRPRVYTQSFPEQLGNFHTHPFYEAPPSVPDLVELALNDREFLRIIRSENALYLLCKPLETALRHNRMSRREKAAIRREEVWGALKQLADPAADREAMMTETAERLGLKIYKADTPEYSTISRRIGLSQEPPPGYKVRVSPSRTEAS